MSHVKVDFHCHSIHGSYDSQRSYEEIAYECKTKGIDIVVFTEHDNITMEKDLIKVQDKYGILLIPGIEKSFNEWGHFLAIGVNDFFKRRKKKEIKKVDLQKGLKKIKNKIKSDEDNYINLENFMRLTKSIFNPIIQSVILSNDPVEFSNALCQAADRFTR